MMWMRRALGLATALAVIGADRASKLWIAGLLEPLRGHLRVGSMLDLVEVHNRGVSFGILNSGATRPVPMIVLASLICLGFLFWLLRAERLMTIFGIGLVIGGACGNIVDRALMGYVLDFLSFHAGPYAWPAFNAADSAICVGAFLLMLDNMRADAQDSRRKPPAAETGKIP